MTPLYSFGIRAYGLAIRLAAPFHSKARLWVRGRKDWKASLQSALNGKTGWIWFHCSSLGEFEQGRPLLEALRKRYPETPVLLTFFSPSGYEVRKDYAGADVVAYLPLDLLGNVEFFLDQVKPRWVFFIKYDLWLNFLRGLRERSIPHFLVSALLGPDSRFLKGWLRRDYADAFRGFSQIYAQDEATLEILLEQVGTDRVLVTGDTRFDRVVQLLEGQEGMPEIEAFIRGRRVVVVGSSYARDEGVVLPAVEALREFNLCWIVAPHQINKPEILEKAGGGMGRMAVYSRLHEASSEAEVLWIDNVGMLSRLYRYSSVAYIGGGFGHGIHNTQEPAVYGNPVFFGPRYQDFIEAVEMVALGTAFSVEESEAFTAKLRALLEDVEALEELRKANRAYMLGKAGATGLILEQLEKV